ncbi:MAG: hypothetical protein M3004_14190, partial [Bacteroidota bacterium]|nr:hypothetical protein [Bacteroidota bacterium]
MQKLFLIILSFAITFSSFAQKNKKEKRDQSRKRIDAMIKQEEEGVITYKKHTAFGAKLINNGYGGFIEIGRAKTVKKGMLYQLEISEYKSTKEEKENNFTNFSTPFSFGKQNFFYPVKLGVQQEILFGNKSNKNGVTITGNYGGGLSVGLLRPYYVQLSRSGNYIKYESADSAKFLDYTAISGGPGFSKGWSDLQIIPGAYVKTALRFDYGSYNEIVSALEVGIVGDFYSKKFPIMVHDTQKQFFFTGYV